MAAIVKMLKQKMPQPVKLNFIRLWHFNLYKNLFQHCFRNFFLQ